MRNFIHYLFAFITIVCLTLGVTNVAFWKQLTNPNLYTESLESSGLVKQTSSILEAYAVNVLSGVSEDLVSSLATEFSNLIFQQENPIATQALTGVIVSLVNERLPQVVSQIFTTYKVEERITDVTINSITNVVLWFSGQKADPEFFRYIPSTQQLEIVESKGVVTIISTYALSSVLGVTNLPECQTQEQVQLSLYAIDEGQLRSVNCVNEEIRPILFAQVQNTIPSGALDRLDTAIEGFLETYNINPVIDSVYQLLFGISTLKEYAFEVREGLMIMYDVGMFLILISIPALFITVLTAKRNRIRGLGVTLSIAGFMILAFGYISQSIGAFGIQNLNLKSIDISNEVITMARSYSFMLSLENFMLSIVSGLFEFVVIVGLYILAGGLTLMFVGILLNRLNKNSKLVTKVDGYSKKITEKTANFKAKLLSKNLKSENANKKSKKG